MMTLEKSLLERDSFLVCLGVGKIEEVVSLPDNLVYLFLDKPSLFPLNNRPDHSLRNVGFPVYLKAHVNDDYTCLLDQYNCFLNGVDNPSRLKFIQFVQSESLRLLNKISGMDTKNEENSMIEQHILDKNYVCQMAVSKNHADQVIQQLDSYKGLNQFKLSDKKVRVLLTKTEISNLIGEELPLPDVKEVEVIQEDDNELIEKRLRTAVKKVGLANSLRINEHRFGVSMRLITSPIPKGVTYSAIVKRSEDLSVAYGDSLSITKGDEPNTITFMIPLKHRQPVYLNKEVNSITFKNYAKDHPLPLFIGKTVSGKPIYRSLNQAPHLLVAGATGSGKSVFLNSVIQTLIKVKTPSEVCLYLIDPKQVEFSQYEKSSHVAGIYKTPDDALYVLKYLVSEMEKRYRLLSQAGAKSISEMRSMQYLVCIIDEYNDLLMQCPDVEPLIARLGQKARAAGISLILSTQRPDSHVMNGVIKTNFPSRISFQLSNNTEYRTVFGRGIPYTNLLGKGDGVMSFNGDREDFIRFQAPVTGGPASPKEQISSLIQSTGETRVRELQKLSGMRINTVSDILKELADEGLLIKTSAGNYEKSS